MERPIPEFYRCEALRTGEDPEIYDYEICRQTTDREFQQALAAAKQDGSNTLVLGELWERPRVRISGLKHNGLALNPADNLGDYHLDFRGRPWPPSLWYSKDLPDQ